ncbi:hypothetical protein [Lysobacter sp. P5_B9]
MFWYYVAPFGETKWSVLFEGQRQPFLYDSEDDATVAALKAARENYYTHHHQPSGVQLRHGDHWVKVFEIFPATASDSEHKAA